MPSDLQKQQVITQETFEGGVSSAFDPDLIRANQLAWGKNINLRGGKITTRGGFKERLLLPPGRVQGIDYFTINDGRLIISINGLISSIDFGLDEFIISDIPTPIARSDTIVQTFFEETSGFMVIQDGQSTAMIFNGSDIRLATDTEVPIGQHMAYGNGRLWVNVGKGRLQAGDIVGVGDTPGSELGFTEDVYLLGGGAFVMPSDIIGMSFMPSNSGTSGYGPLLVMGSEYVVAMRADIASRAQWSEVQGFQSTIFPKIGSSGHYSSASANLDLLFRDNQGEIRSVRQSSVDVNLPGSTPSSREVSRVTENESTDMLLTSPSMYHNSRLLAASQPRFIFEDQVGFRSIISQDFAPLGSQSGKGAPIYNGEWSGFNVTHSVLATHNGVERSFFVSKDEEGQNRLWEYIEDQRIDISTDTAGDPVETQIEQEIEFRREGYNSPHLKKRLTRFDVWLSEIEDTTVTIYFRPDNDPQWHLWDSYSFCNDLTDDSLADPHVWKELRTGYKTQVIPFTASSLDGDPNIAVGFEFQVKLRIEGHCKIEKVVGLAEILEGADVYSVDSKRPSPKVVEELEITPIELFYEIPVFNPVLGDYVDEAADNYTDENGDSYGG